MNYTDKRGFYDSMFIITVYVIVIFVFVVIVIFV